MAIAVLNKTSKIVHYAARLGLEDEIEEALEGHPDFIQTADDIIGYIDDDRDKRLYDQLNCLVDTKTISDFSAHITDPSTRSSIDNLVKCINKLKVYAESLYSEDYKDFPYLVPYFANEEMKALLMRSVNAGILNEKYQPKKGIKQYHLKLIALAIIKIKDIKTRNKWCHFEKQWNIEDKHLSRCEVPLTRGADVYKISKIYPEVDFFSVFEDRVSQAKAFKTSLKIPQVKILCTLLKEHGFLAGSIQDESVMAIMGLLRIPPQPVDWSGSAYSLVYFVKQLFGDLNPSSLHMAERWFTVKGKTLNHGTIKTKSSTLNRERSRFDFIPIIDDIIREANN